jgi:hypothetical protein
MSALYPYLIRVFRLYYDGFRSLSWWGRRVWIIILIKMFIIFIILKIFFFRDFLAGKCDTENEKSRYVLEQLINSK